MGKKSAAKKIYHGLTPIFTLAAWGLTIALVYHLLSGTFESGRSCRTDCVRTIYWSAFIIALAGLAAGLATIKQKTFLSLLLRIGPLVLLLAIFAVMMFIGTFL